MLERETFNLRKGQSILLRGSYHPGFGFDLQAPWLLNTLGFHP